MVAARSSYLITMSFTTITAAVLAEICSVLPVAGSIYIWAAQSAGPKYSRFFGILVAWWACTAWMTFAANNSQVMVPFYLFHVLFPGVPSLTVNWQATTDYLISILVVYGVDFPGGINTDNVKWRAVVWILSEGLFVMGIALNYLPRMSIIHDYLCQV